MRLRSWTASRRKGFALLIVIWGLGAIALLVVSFLTTGRLRLQTAFNVAGAAQAQSIAAAATDLAILSLAREILLQNGPAAPAPHDGAPNFCTLDNSLVAVAVEDESGKVDLNTASEQLLQNMLVGLLAMAPAQASAIARGIAEFRTPAETDLPPPPLDGKPFGPKRAAFQTALELDQVAGVDLATFRALLPFVTVHSRIDGIDPHVAPPALVAALLGMPHDSVAALAAAPFPNGLNRDDPRFPSAYRQAGGHGAFLIHSEVVLANGPSGVRESIVEMPATDNNAPFVVREIRRGAPRYLDALRQMREAAITLPPC
jgi:general secretion pathway protein K